MLGKAGPFHLIADIEFEHTGPGGFGEFYVAFQTRPASQGRKIVIDTGAGTLGNVRIHAQDYVHLGRKQIFISSQMGRVCTYLFDYNGRGVRKLYARDEGRVGVKLVRVGHHKLLLVESWPLNQYTDGEEDLGVGFLRGKQGVIRTLRWQHGQFVPLYPGPTTIEPSISARTRVVHFHALALIVPMGWKVVPTSDLPPRLYGRSADFDLIASNPQTQRLCAATTREKVIHLGLSNDNTGMVRVKGGLVGRPYTTIHRLHGLLDDNLNSRDDTYDWSFYLLNRPNRRTGDTITISVYGLSGSVRSQKRFMKLLINKARMARQ